MDMERYGVFTRSLRVLGFLVLLLFSSSAFATDIFNDVRASVIIRDLAFDGTTYVAAGNNGIWISTDLRKWQKIQTPPVINSNVGVNAVAWGGGMFVGTFAGGLLSSPDGTTWTLTYGLGGQPALQFVTYNNGSFMATGVTSSGDPALVSSPDGVNWTPVSISASVPGATQYPAQRVGWGNGLYVMPIFTDNGFDVVLTSPDGLNWTQATLPAGGSTGILDTFGSAAYGAGLYVVGGDTFIYTSPDGVNWTLTPFNGVISPTDRWIGDKFAFLNGQFVAVGRVSRYTQAVFTSPDGFNWTPTALGLHQASFFDTSSAVFNGTDLVVGGDLGVWKGRTVATLKKVFTGPQTNGMYCLGFGSGQFLIAPYAIYNDSLLLSSTDGVKWPTTFASVGFNLGGSMQPGCIASSGGLFVLAGGGTVFGNNQIYSSPDGVSWNLGNVPADSSDLGQVAWDAVHGVFLSLGSSNGYSTGAAFTSPDGVNWSETADVGLPPSDMSGYSLRTLAGTAFAFSGGSLFESTDGGNNWMSESLPSGFTEFDDVAFGATLTGGAVYVAVGADASDNLLTAASTDGVNWTTNPGLSYPLIGAPGSVVYGGGEFIASGQNIGGGYFVSHDGVNWARGSSYSFGMEMAAWDGTQIVATTFTDIFDAPGVDLNLVGAAPAHVNTGKAFKYTLTIKDATGKVDATGVILTDTLPVNVTFGGVTSTAGSCTRALGTVTCMIPAVVHGTPVKVVLDVTAGAVSGVAVNTARVVADQPVYDSAVSVLNTSVVIN